MEWLGFRIGVVALIKPTMVDKASIPTRYHNGLRPPMKTVKNTHRSMYHAVDSDIIR
jgi:hypothetical protein